MKVTIVAGARPNFMKVAPIIRQIQAEEGVEYRLVHTGQHFDHNMSGSFFADLNIPLPDANLGCGSGSQAQQTASIMTGFEAELYANRPDLVIVVGDVNSTMACAITAKKMHIRVAHVEAGIRSGDMKMPEEINRIVTDSICDDFFVTTIEAMETLIKEGHDTNKIHFVGNVMIDTLVDRLPHLVQPECAKPFNRYLVVTLHRPSNVDNPFLLRTQLDAIMDGANGVPVIFPVHPRTRKAIEAIEYSAQDLVMVEPMGYLEFMHLVKNAAGVITDSGGVTEETTFLNVPCMTLRTTTERPETVRIGTNMLVENDRDKIKMHVSHMAEGVWKMGRKPKLWDGCSAERIVATIRNFDLKPACEI